MTESKDMKGLTCHGQEFDFYQEGQIIEKILSRVVTGFLLQYYCSGAVVWGLEEGRVTWKSNSKTGNPNQNKACGIGKNAGLIFRR